MGCSEGFHLFVQFFEAFFVVFEEGGDVGVDGFALADGGARFGDFGGVFGDERLQGGEIGGFEIVVVERGGLGLGAVVDELAKRGDLVVAHSFELRRVDLHVVAELVVGGVVGEGFDHAGEFDDLIAEAFAQIGFARGDFF